MRKAILPILLAGCLSGCGILHGVYKPDVQQGNIITAKMISQLHVGMSAGQVKAILGEPVLINTFSNRRWAYVYTFLPGQGKLTEKRLTVFFKHGVMTHYISGSARTMHLPKPLGKLSARERIQAEKMGA